MNRKFLGTGLFFLLLAGCWSGCSKKDSSERTGTSGTCDPSDSSCKSVCQTNFDCGDTQLYECISQKCVAVCLSGDDCQAHPQYDQGPWPGCEDGLCKCADKKCSLPVCSDESDCRNGKVCKAGKCISPENSVKKCRVYPDLVVMGIGQKARFSVVGYGEEETVVFPGRSAFTWTANNGQITDGNIVEFKANSSGSAVVQAALSAHPEIQCQATVNILSTAGKAQVVVVDDQSGRLVQGARVVWNGKEMEQTNPLGVFTLSEVPLADPATVSVFHNDYEYVSLIGISKNHLRIPIRRQAFNQVGGFKGKFQPFPLQGLVVGIAGMSIPEDLTDLDTDTFLGPTETVSVDLTGQGIPIPIRAPSGTALGVGATTVKERYVAYGAAGICSDEAKTLAGQCGTRAGFGLMGSIPLNSSPELLLAIQQGTVQASQLLEAVIPFLDSFKSVVVRDVGFGMKAVDRNNAPALAQAIADDGVFVPRDMSPSVEFSLRHTVEVPTLPKANGVVMGSVMVIAASEVAGRGLVPLGFGAGSDSPSGCGEACTANGLVTGVELGSREPLTLRYHDDGNLTVRMAPAQGGVENSPYKLVTWATSDSGWTANSAVVHSSQALSDGGKTRLDGFLGLIEQGNYALRTGVFEGVNAVEKATVRRALFASSQGQRWMVYFKNNTFSVPLPLTGYSDRTTANLESRSSASTRSSLLLQALRVADETREIKMDELFDLESGRVGAISDSLKAFSVYEK